MSRYKAYFKLFEFDKYFSKFYEKYDKIRYSVSFYGIKCHRLDVPIALKKSMERRGIEIESHYESSFRKILENSKFGTKNRKRQIKKSIFGIDGLELDILYGHPRILLLSISRETKILLNNAIQEVHTEFIKRGIEIKDTACQWKIQDDISIIAEDNKEFDQIEINQITFI